MITNEIDYDGIKYDVLINFFLRMIFFNLSPLVNFSNINLPLTY